MAGPNEGVTAPLGFLASGVSCGFKKGGLPDLGLLVSTTEASSAGVFTSNRVKGHSLLLTRARVGGAVRAVVMNSGQANACLGPRGDEDARAICRLAAHALGRPEEEVLIASTGVIGQPLDLEAAARGIRQAASALSPSGGDAAARAIMTTDTFPKQGSVSLRLGGRTITIGGMAKGSGMIHPNLATLLCFLTTDAPVSSEVLQSALGRAVERSFNSVTIDGDTSPCDCVLLLANGAAGGEQIPAGSEACEEFSRALTELSIDLARKIASDGEGATKLVTIRVSGARTAGEARGVGRAVAVSPLVKTAVFGEDANWGRILSAVGNSGADIDPGSVTISLGDVQVCACGASAVYSEEDARAALARPDIRIGIDLGAGDAEAEVWTCDLGHEYVRINGSYRS